MKADRKKPEDYLKADKDGCTGLHDAAFHGSLLDALKDFQAARQPLSLAQLLIQDNLGRNGLHWAAWSGCLDQIEKVVQASHESLHLQYFLSPKEGHRTALHWAAEQGHLDQLFAVLRPSGEKFSFEHFLMKDHRNRTPLKAAVENHHLHQIFVPTYWEGRVGDMVKLWDEVPQEKRNGFDFETLRDEALSLTVQSAPKIDLKTFGGAARSTSLSSLWHRFKETVLPSRNP